jgi:hypothetical protein
VYPGRSARFAVAFCGTLILQPKALIFQPKALIFQPKALIFQPKTFPLIVTKVPVIAITAKITRQIARRKHKRA